MSEPAWELPPLEPVEFNDLSLPAGLWRPSPHPAFDLSDRPEDGGDGPTYMSLERHWPEPDRWQPGERFSSFLSLLPIIGTIKDVIEGIKGDDLITGKPLSARKRAFNFLAAAADLIGAGVAGRLLKGGGMAAKAIKGLKTAGEIAKESNRAEDVYTIAPFLKPPFDAN